MLMNHFCQLESVEFRHAHIHEHDGDIILEQLLQRLAPGGGLDQIFTKLAEYDLVAQKLRGLVIHHQDVDFAFSAHRVFPSSSCAVFRETPRLEIGLPLKPYPERREAAFCRITCMVSYPSISGIMMSIRTIATSGVDSRVAIASRPVPAVRTL